MINKMNKKAISIKNKHEFMAIKSRIITDDIKKETK